MARREISLRYALGSTPVSFADSMKRRRALHPDTQASTLGKVVRVTDAEAGAQELALACFEVEAGSLELLQELLEDADEA